LKYIRFQGAGEKDDPSAGPDLPKNFVPTKKPNSLYLRWISSALEKLHVESYKQYPLYPDILGPQLWKTYKLLKKVSEMKGQSEKEALVRSFTAEESKIVCCCLEILYRGMASLEENEDFPFQLLSEIITAFRESLSHFITSLSPPEFTLICGPTVASES